MKSYNSIFSYENTEPDNREASKIEFEVPSDMNIHEYKIMCVRMAKAMGYGDKSIKKVFGDLNYTSESDKEFERLLTSLNITRNETE